MKKWSVSVPVYASLLITVSAETEQEAIEIGERQASRSLCNQCAGHIEIGDQDISADTVAEELND